MFKRIPRHWLFGGGVLFFIVGFIIWVTLAYARNHRVATVGDPAPDIQLTTVDGRDFKLGSLKGHPIFINYFATWCGPCIEETPDLVQFAKAYGNKIDIVMIDRGDTKSMVRSYLRSNHFPANVTVLMDYGDDWSQPLGVTGQPETFYLNTHGIILEHLLGPLTESQMVHYTKKSGANL